MPATESLLVTVEVVGATVVTTPVSTGQPGPAGPPGAQGVQGIQGAQGPPGVAPANAALLDHSNTFTVGGQAIHGDAAQGAVFTVAGIGGSGTIFAVAAGGYLFQVTDSKVTISNASLVFGTQANVAPKDSSSVGLAIVALAGQTGNLQEWRDQNGNPLAYVSPAGNFTLPGLTVQGLTTCISPAADKVALAVKAFSAAQTADIMQWQDAGGVMLSGVDKYGYVRTRVGSGAPPQSPPDGALYLDVTNFKLYARLAGLWKSVQLDGAAGSGLVGANRHPLTFPAAGFSWSTQKPAQLTTGGSIQMSGAQTAGGTFPFLIDFSLPVGSGWAFSFWLKTTINQRQIFQLQGPNSLLYLSVGKTTVFGTDNKLVYYLRSTDNAHNIFDGGNFVSVNDGNWHHLCFFLRSTENTVKVYHNGVSDCNPQSWTWDISFTAADTGMVGYNSGNGLPFVGNLADFRFYKGVNLTDADISVLAAGGSPNPSGLSCWWKFDETSGLVARDSA